MTPSSKEAIAERLAEARLRTLELIQPLDDEQLNRVYSPILSPLAWDLGHIANFEELWLVQTIGGREPLHGELGRFYDAIENPRKTRGELPILRDAELRAYLADVRERTLEVLDEVEIGPDAEDPLLREGFVYEMLLAHEQQHNETMLQLLQMVDGYEPIDAAAPRAQRPASRIRPRDGRGGRGRARDRRSGPRLRLRQRARPPRGRARPLRDRSNPGQQRRVHPVHGGDRRRASAVLGARRRRGMGADGDGKTRPGRPGPSRPPCLLARGRRLRPLGRQAPARPSRSGRRRTRACEGVGQAWEWTSSDFLAYPGFEAFPYREYSEAFFGDAYKVLRGGSWATDRNVMRPSFRNWDLPQRRQIFAGDPLREGRMIAIEVHLDADAAATMARDVRAGLSADPKELAPKYFYDERGSQLFEQITELPEYYPTRAERSILAERAAEIVAAAGAPRTLVELGSGSAAKTRHLLSAMRDAGCLRHLRPGRHLRGDHPRDRRVPGRGVPGPRRPRPRLRLRAPPRAHPRTAAAAASSPSSAARSATSTPKPAATSSPGSPR